MNRAMAGVIWGLAFIILEAIQFVFFGGIFQKVSSFLFGFLVFGITTAAFVGWIAVAAPDQLRVAFVNPRHLIAVNVTATLAWASFLASVQLIEPAVAYTIGAGVMPVTAYLAYRCGVTEGEPMRNSIEALGILLILAGVVYLAAITVLGGSGFVRGSMAAGLAGILFAVADGVFFTWLLIHCQRMDRSGVGPAAVFGLRFPLYVVVAGGMAMLGVGHKETLPWSEVMLIVAIGIVLIVPPLYALQRAVALISTLTISALTAAGPFVIFLLQMIEGRVAYSLPTLAGLVIYFAGAILAASGAVKAAAGKPVPYY